MARKIPFLLVSTLLLLACATPSGRADTAIPFQLRDGFIAIEGVLEGHSERLNLLLDSGASVSVLSDKTASRLQIPRGRAFSVRAIGADALASQIRTMPAYANGVALSSFEVAADLRAADQFCSHPVDGLIGVRFFRERVVEIDFPARRLILRSNPDYAGDLRIPLRLQNDVLCALVGVNGSRHRWTRLDTGCNEALHWVVPKRTASSTRRSGSIGFASAAADLARVSVALGDRRFPATDAVLHGREIFPGESGLLGMGLLSRFSRVIVDWDGRVLALYR